MQSDEKELAMAKLWKRLSDAFCRNVTKVGRYGDGRGGNGLAMIVSLLTSGHLSKVWGAEDPREV